MSSDLRMLQLMGRIDNQQLYQGRRPLSTANNSGDQAFEIQMRMLQGIFGEKGPDDQNPFFADASIMDDALMYDALATISRLFMQQQASAKPLVPERLAPTITPNFALPAKYGTNDTGRIKADNTVYEVVNGELSAVFESGQKGSISVGYDRVGGTSYGTYQIASRTGSMNRFMTFLKSEAPDIAKRLAAAGPANTGSKSGRMPRVWREIAKEQPEQFETLQRTFIKKDHYTPARNKILAATGLDIDQAPAAVREVLWSTSVQHGATGAARIFTSAIGLGSFGREMPDFERLVSSVYDSRKGSFHSSSRRVRHSVQNRLEREQDVALSMLKHGLTHVV